MPSIRAVPKLDLMTSSLTSVEVGSASSEIRPEVWATTRVSTDTPIGIIITAVAVLETHMDRNPVAIMNPATTPPGLVPMALTVTRAIRRCRFHRCMARARMKPPMNRKMMLLP